MADDDAVGNALRTAGAPRNALVEALLGARNAIPENAEHGFSVLNMLRGGLGSAAGWMDWQNRLSPDAYSPQEVLAPPGMGFMRGAGSAVPRVMEPVATGMQRLYGNTPPLSPPELAEIYSRHAPAPWWRTQAAELGARAVERAGAMNAEVPAQAAVRLGDQMFTGPTHMHAIDAASKRLGDDVVEALLLKAGRSADGFVTNKIDPKTGMGRFITRDEASRLLEGKPGSGYTAEDAWERLLRPATAQTERPVRAAIKLGDNVFEGHTHGDAVVAAEGQLGHDNVWRQFNMQTGFGPGSEGFVTNSGRYVTRQEATDLLGKHREYPGELHATSLHRVQRENPELFGDK